MNSGKTIFSQLMGIRSRVSRNTLANANQVRDWHIYADFAQVLIRTARELYINDSFAVDLKETVYALDGHKYVIYYFRFFIGIPGSGLIQQIENRK